MSEVNLGIIDLCTLCIAKNYDLKQAAHTLNLSVSTVQRKLKREGVTYSDLKEKVSPKQASVPPNRAVANNFSRSPLDGGSGSKPGALLNSHSTGVSHQIERNPLFSSGNDGGMDSARALEKLTEDVLEDAIVKGLRADPTRVLSVALSFLEKKKGLSIEDEDTNNTLVQGDKLKRIRRNMFV